MKIKHRITMIQTDIKVITSQRFDEDGAFGLIVGSVFSSDSSGAFLLEPVLKELVLDCKDDTDCEEGGLACNDDGNFD